MQKDNTLYLQDIIEAIEKIQHYTKGLNYESFESNQLVIDATILNLITIGEASRRLPKDIKDKNQDIPWKALIGMRNILVHQYHRVDLDILWNLIETELENTKIQVNSIMDKTIDE